MSGRHFTRERREAKAVIDDALDEMFEDAEAERQVFEQQAELDALDCKLTDEWEDAQLRAELDAWDYFYDY